MHAFFYLIEGIKDFVYIFCIWMIIWVLKWLCTNGYIEHFIHEFDVFGLIFGMDTSAFNIINNIWNGYLCIKYY